MKKWLTVAIFTLIFTTIFSATSYAEDNIKIGLHYGNNKVKEVEISCDKGLILVDRGNEIFTDGKMVKNVKISLSRDAFNVYTDSSNAPNIIKMPVDSDILFAVIKPKPGGILHLNGKAYRGNIKVWTDTKNYDGSFFVFNELSMEDYLRGVVPKEVSSSWNAEALKAQAVCARTYTQNYLGKHSKDKFDLCTTEDCQVYGGMSAETPETNAAIDATKGQILTYDGKPAQVFYFATSGGYTEDVKYVWGSSYPYLSAVEDKYESPKSNGYKWELTISEAELNQILSKYNIGNIKNIIIEETSPHGSVTKLHIYGESGEKILTNESARIFLGYGKLKSQAYTVKKNGDIPKLFTTSGEISGTFSTISKDGIASFTGDTVSVLGKTKVSIPLTVTGGDGYIFTGRGNGHLIGMSQNGAKGMAEAGFTYDKILTHYFQGTTVTQYTH